jgi:hypothetical protein
MILIHVTPNTLIIFLDLRQGRCNYVETFTLFRPFEKLNKNYISCKIFTATKENGFYPVLNGFIIPILIFHSIKVTL